MLDEPRHELRHMVLEAFEQGTALEVEPFARIELFPQGRDAGPLRMRVERLTDRSAEFHAQPGRGMRIVDIDAKYEGARQADDADQADRRGDADTSHREEIRDDFGDPSIPDRPQILVGAGLLLERFQHGAQRGNKLDQRSRLMPRLVNERRGDAAADHSLARDTDDRDGTCAAAGQPRARPADSGARPALQVTHDRRQLVELALKSERIGRDRVET
ncbi:hypothetical protein D9M68_453540 [compost metagenome]